VRRPRTPDAGGGAPRGAVGLARAGSTSDCAVEQRQAFPLSWRLFRPGSFWAVAIVRMWALPVLERLGTELALGESTSDLHTITDEPMSLVDEKRQQPRAGRG
jgi:hypothetical protein